MIFSDATKEGFRRLRASPRLSIAVVLCIALGMAATASVATLISLTTYRALPFPDAERLVRVWNTEQGRQERNQLAWMDYSDLRDGMETVERMEAAARARLIWHRPDRPGRRVEGEAVSDGYFELLDVEPYMGRLFSNEEKATGAPVMLLSHGTWGREFGYSEDILGATIRTSTQYGEATRSYTVIGVLPPDFHGSIEDDMPDLEYWVPINSYYSPDDRQARDVRGTWVIGRLAVDASLDAARAEAHALADALAPAFADFAPDHEYRVEPLGANWRAGYTEANGLLAGAAVLLLVVAIFNVAMLLVARAMARRHESALRAALGAGRRRLILPVVTETLLLAVAGGAIGLAGAGPLLDAFLSLSGAQVPTYLEVRPDGATLAVSFAAMVAAGLSAALLPAWASTRVDVNDALREGSGRLAGSRPAARWGRWLVGAEIALTVALMLGGALLGRTYLALENRDLGYDADSRLRMGLFVNPADVPEDSALPAFMDRVESALRSEPGVLEVTSLWPTLPMAYAIPGRLQWPGMPEAERDPGTQVSHYVVHHGFFGALDIPRIAGRTFDTRDREADMRTAVISRSLAERLGGPMAAVEREVTLDGEAFRVVGVVGDVLFGGPREGPEFRHEVYLSYAQSPRRIVSPIVHVAGDPDAYADRLRRTVARIAPNSALDWVGSVRDATASLYRDSAFRLAVVAAFALSALLLAAIGLYAVLAQQVAAATTEIGVRKALGASNRHILGRILCRGLAVTLAGLAAGLALFLACSRALSGFLHEAGPFDPVAYATASGALLAVAAFACLLPARRAARIAPMEALRHE